MTQAKLDAMAIKPIAALRAIRAMLKGPYAATRLREYLLDTVEWGLEETPNDQAT